MKLQDLVHSVEDVTKMRPHARKAWDGKAYVMVDDRGLRITQIEKGGTNAPYGCTFDDLMADDWEFVEVEGQGYSNEPTPVKPPRWAALHRLFN